MTTNNKDNTLSIGRSNYDVFKYCDNVSQYLNTAFEHYVLQRHSKYSLVLPQYMCPL